MLIFFALSPNHLYHFHHSMHFLPFFISSSLRTGYNRSLTQNLTLTYRNRPRLPDTSRYIPSTSCLPQPSPSLLPQHALSPILHLFVTSDGLESVFNSKPDPDIPQHTTLARHFTLYQFYVMAGSNTKIRYGNCIVHTSCLNIHTHVTKLGLNRYSQINDIPQLITF